ncbi:hypothetical protein DdX_21226 [Ditylenchus destructor]|uniref:Uncharacterized protein n=1 Tax=Ditylenchus destructor TaxID=166010 RepID=A0AAD4MG16_9BILA|nr:hypothetical protein DdX_21226 [Ditylenchus destructor]
MAGNENEVWILTVQLTLQLIFFIIVIPPLIKISRTRHALYLVLYKSVSALLYSIFGTLPFILAKEGILVPYLRYLLFLTLWAVNMLFFSLIAVAFNRFHAIFFAQSYIMVWRRRLSLMLLYSRTTLTPEQQLLEGRRPEIVSCCSTPEQPNLTADGGARSAAVHANRFLAK